MREVFEEVRLALLVAAIVMAPTACFWASKTPSTHEIVAASKTTGYVVVSGRLDRQTISATGR